MTNEAQLREKLRALCLLASEAFSLLDPEPHAPALTLAWDSELKKMPLRTKIRRRDRQKRYFWNSLKRSYPKCRNFLEPLTS